MSKDSNAALIRETDFSVTKAIWKLAAARKQTVSEFDTDLRKLKKLHEILLVKSDDSSQAELFEPGSFLSPEQKALIERWA